MFCIIGTNDKLKEWKPGSQLAIRVISLHISLLSVIIMPEYTQKSAASRVACVLLIELNGVVVGVSKDGVAGSSFESEQFFNGGLECFVHIGCAFRARFEERQPPVGLAPRADLFGGNWCLIQYVWENI